MKSGSTYLTETVGATFRNTSKWVSGPSSPATPRTSSGTAPSATSFSEGWRTCTGFTTKYAWFSKKAGVGSTQRLTPKMKNAPRRAAQLVHRRRGHLQPVGKQGLPGPYQTGRALELLSQLGDPGNGQQCMWQMSCKKNTAPSTGIHRVCGEMALCRKGEALHHTRHSASPSPPTVLIPYHDVHGTPTSLAYFFAFRQ